MTRLGTMADAKLDVVTIAMAVVRLREELGLKPKTVDRADARHRAEVLRLILKGKLN